jgi:FdhD protein
MDNSKKNPEPVIKVRAVRITAEENKIHSSDEDVNIAEEAPLTIDVEGVENYTLLCTPSDKKALALGFLLSEGIIGSMDDIAILKVCDDDLNTIRVKLKDDIPRIDDAGRNLLIVSSCGACGSENLEKRIESLPAVGNSLKISANVLQAVYKSLREKQILFDISGGTHAAAVFNHKGKILTFAEDTGRHNALDKSLGKCLLNNIKPGGLAVALTSRLSLEMVSRCARAGIELVCAVSAPTSMAIKVAKKCNITLCAFVRETRSTIFSYPERIDIAGN